ncbi:hypothetical protein [Streptomyces sp. NPDC003832]
MNGLIDDVDNGLALVAARVDIPALYVIAACGLLAVTATAVVAAGYWTFRYIAWASRQPGIRRLEAFANHPGARRLLNDTRKETDQP